MTRFGAIGGLSVMVCAALAMSGVDGLAAPRGFNDAARPQASGAVAQPIAYTLTPGSRITYRLDYDSRSNADLRKLFQGTAGAPPEQAGPSNLVYALIAALHGTYTMTIVRTTPTRIEALCSVASPAVQVNVNGNEQTSQASAVAADLASGFLVTLAPDGKVISLNLPAAAGKFSQDFAKALLGSIEFVLAPGSALNDKWQAHEEDRDGEYIAEYSAGANSGGQSPAVVVTKRFARYLAPKQLEGSTTMPGKVPAQRSVTPSGSVKAQFDPARGVLTSLDGREIKDTAIQGTNIAHSETAVRLALLSRDNVAAAQLASYQKEAESLRTGSAALALFSQPNPEEVEANIQRTELGNSTLDELMVQLGTVEIGEGKVEETPVYLKFKALVYLHPEACAELAKAVSDASATSPSFRIIVGSLGAVGNPEAQAAIVTLIEKRDGDWPALAELIATLGGVPRPTSASEGAVYKVAATVSDSNTSAAALLALGSMAKNLARDDPKGSAAIVERLESLLSISQTDDQREHVLEALGNSASDSALPAFLHYAKNSSPDLRAASMDGLRNIRSGQADAALLHSLSEDGDKQVRLEAAFALGFRKPSQISFTTQKEVLAKESDEKVRAAILSNIAKMNRSFPQSRKVIENSAANDPSEYVRKTASGLLTTDFGESSARN